MLSGLFRLRAVRLAFLRVVDAAETDAFRMLVVQDFDGIALDDPNYSSGEGGGPDKSWDQQGCQQQELCPVGDHDRRKVATNCHRVARR